MIFRILIRIHIYIYINKCLWIKRKRTKIKVNPTRYIKKLPFYHWPWKLRLSIHYIADIDSYEEFRYPTRRPPHCQSMKPSASSRPLPRCNPACPKPIYTRITDTRGRAHTAISFTFRKRNILKFLSAFSRSGLRYNVIYNFIYIINKRNIKTMRK